MFGQHKKKKADKEVEVDLNRVVTPMLDMTFQILFFLIMNFRLPTPEGQIDLLLPQEDTGSAVMPPEDLLDETKHEYKLRLYVFGNQTDKIGAIAYMTWRQEKPQKQPKENINFIDPGENNEKDPYFQRLDSLLYGLVVKLREFQPKEGDKKSQPTITIECDKRLVYKDLTRVMDVLRKMKFTQVGVKPIPKDGKD